MTLPNNAEAGKRVSVTDSSHQIRPERNISQPQMIYFVRNTATLKTCIGKQYTYGLRAYITRSTFQPAAGEKGFASLDELIKFFKDSFATYGHLLDQASYRQSDQFSSVVKKKGLVSSSYSSAAEFPTAITDRLRESSGSYSNSREQFGHLRLSSEQWYCNTVLIICTFRF